MTTATLDQDSKARVESQPTIEPTALAPLGKAAGLPVIEDGQFANLLDTKRFEHMWRVASLFSKSGMVPEHYRGKPENCFIALQMAVRLQVDPYMFMQNTYVIQGKPGIEAKLAIALINTSGLFTDSLDYEIEGDDPKAKGYRVRAWAKRKTTGKRIEGPWVTWDMVDAEGWSSKSGSKWKTIPALMFQYRAAMFFGRLHCPERLMGMQTVEELDDVQTRFVDARVLSPGESKSADLANRLSVDPDTSPAGTVEKAQDEAAEAGDTSYKTAGAELSESDRKAIRWTELCELQSQHHGGDVRAAESRLAEFCSKVFNTVPKDLTDQQFADLAGKVNGGEIKPRK